MLKLTNVTKTYVSKKKKQKVNALKDVSFELENTGMVFILGKSGSGKSTLLNLLGGLDSPTAGEIVVDGVSMKDFKQADYEGYRNGYVGFIFQEYNLLDEFNVKDNIALALHLSKGDNIGERVLAALQQVELSEDYLTRQVGEMSGGEKQRIAIARTIVKESKMILADEPTGNLDSATSESIWNILKELSKTKLVVVVSHDRESATKYGDRVIEIADGSVIADSGNQDADNEVKEKFTPQKKSLSFVTCLRMGVNSLFQHKVRSVSVLLLSILSLFALIVTQLCLSYSANLTIVKFIKKYDVNYFVVEEDRIPRKEDRAFLDNNSTYIKYSKMYNEGTVKCKQDILDMGLSFVGEALELDQHSFYVTSKELTKYEALITGGNDFYKDHFYYLDDNGDKVYINEKPSSWEFFIGKRIALSSSKGDIPPILAGIVDLSNVSNLALDYIPPIFVSEEFLSDYRFFSNRITLSEKDGYIDFGGDQRYSGSMIIDGFMNMPSSTQEVVTEDGFADRRWTIGDGEIVVTYEMLAAFFPVKSRFDYVRKSMGSYVLVEVPEQVGHTYPFVLYDENGELIADFGELKIVGVSFNLESGQNIEACVSHATSWDFFPATCNEFLVKTSSVHNLRSFVNNLSKKHFTEVYNAGAVQYLDNAKNRKDCVGFANDFTDNISYFTSIITLISAVMSLILLALVTNLISLSIAGRKREIGILSALGTSNRDIAKIFIIETMVLATITFVVVLIASFISVAVINKYYNYNYYKIDHIIPFFNVGLPTAGILIAATFGLHLLGALLPLTRIAKIKPIDAIRNT